MAASSEGAAAVRVAPGRRRRAREQERQQRGLGLAEEEEIEEAGSAGASAAVANAQLSGRISAAPTPLPRCSAAPSAGACHWQSSEKWSSRLWLGGVVAAGATPGSAAGGRHRAPRPAGGERGLNRPTTADTVR